MFKKIFNAVDELEAPQNVVEKAVAAAEAAQQSGKVLEMKPKNNKKKYTIIGALAASLAVVIAMGAVFYPSANKTATTSKNKDNSFFLVADAAETKRITDKDFTAIGTIEPSGYDAEFDNGKLREKVDYFYFNIACKGNNIKTVSYSISDNSRIFIQESTKNKLKSFEGTSSRFDINTCKGDINSDYYSRFSTSAANQLKAADKAEIAVYTKNRPEIEAVMKNYELFEDADEVVDIKDTKTRDKFINYLDSYFKTVLKDVKVTAAVEYDDNTTEEKSLIFSPTVKAVKESVIIRGDDNSYAPDDYRDMWSFEITLNAKISD